MAKKGATQDEDEQQGSYTIKSAREVASADIQELHTIDTDARQAQPAPAHLLQADLHSQPPVSTASAALWNTGPSEGWPQHLCCGIQNQGATAYG